ncbi:MAG: VWA domain-containing protein [Methylotenera sp.]|nr:VWA domain-containing protein [Methylotenera sp.]
MNKLIRKFIHHKDLYLLLVCFILLAIALFRPTVPVKHNIYSYFMVIDITQSMNTVDMKINGKPVSRIAYTKQILRETISSLPCGTKVGLGMFSGVNVVTLYLPIDVCENFSSIQDTLDHIDWRSAWTADSRVRESMLSSARVVSNFPEPAQVVYFSDGEEAPKLHAFNTRDLSTLQNADGWLLVGIGSMQGAAIPKFTEKNQLIGYWSHESMQLAPGAAPIAAAGLLKRKRDVAESVNDRYIAKLSETSMMAMAKEIGATYVRGDNLQALLSAMRKQKPARREWTPISIDWLLGTLAGLILLFAYVPQHPLKKLKKRFSGKKQTQSSHQLSNHSPSSITLD